VKSVVLRTGFVEKERMKHAVLMVLPVKMKIRGFVVNRMTYFAEKPVVKRKFAVMKTGISAVRTSVLVRQVHGAVTGKYVRVNMASVVKRERNT